MTKHFANGVAVQAVIFAVSLTACLTPAATHGEREENDKSDLTNDRYVLSLEAETNDDVPILVELDPATISFDLATFSASDAQLLELLPYVTPYTDVLGQDIWDAWGIDWNTTYALDIGNGIYCVFPSPESYQSFERFSFCDHEIFARVAEIED